MKTPTAVFIVYLLGVSCGGGGGGTAKSGGASTVELEGKPPVSPSRARVAIDELKKLKGSEIVLVVSSEIEGRVTFSKGEGEDTLTLADDLKEEEGLLDIFTKLYDLAALNDGKSEYPYPFDGAFVKLAVQNLAAASAETESPWTVEFADAGSDGWYCVPSGGTSLRMAVKSGFSLDADLEASAVEEAVSKLVEDCLDLVDNTEIHLSADLDFSSIDFSSLLNQANNIFPSSFGNLYSAWHKLRGMTKLFRKIVNLTDASQRKKEPYLKLNYEVVTKGGDLSTHSMFPNNLNLNHNLLNKFRNKTKEEKLLIAMDIVKGSINNKSWSSKSFDVTQHALSYPYWQTYLDEIEALLKR